MLLDDLHTLIETLRERISEHGPALRKSEALTRYALIDPLLRELGWNTTDPAQVVVEFPLPKGSQKGFADYALLSANDPPRLIVEAKSLGSALDQAAAQALGYCNVLGIPHFAVTDGERWLVYETFQPVPLTDKLVATLDLNDSPSVTCLNALALWQPAVATGHVQAAKTPITPESTAAHPQSMSESSSQTEAVNDEPNLDNWYALSTFAPTSGQQPAQIRFPSGEIIATPYWGWVTKGIVQWLIDQGHLSAHHLPIQTSTGKILVTEPSENPDHQILSKVGPFLVNANFTAKPQVINSRTTIERVGLNPADFAVRLAK